MCPAPPLFFSFLQHLVLLNCFCMCTGHRYSSFHLGAQSNCLQHRGWVTCSPRCVCFFFYCSWFVKQTASGGADAADRSSIAPETRRPPRQKLQPLRHPPTARFGGDFPCAVAKNYFSFARSYTATYLNVGRLHLWLFVPFVSRQCLFLKAPCYTHFSDLNFASRTPVQQCCTINNLKAL